MFTCFFIIVLLTFVAGLYLYRTYINPTTIFTAGFLIGSVMCYVYYYEWQMDLFNTQTTVLLSMGILAYSLACVVVKLCYRSNKRFVRPTRVRVFNLSGKLLVAYIAFQLVTLLLYCRFATQATGEGDILAAVSTINKEFMFGDSTLYNPGPLLNNANFVMLMLNYYFMFVLAKMYAFKERTDERKLILIVCIVGTLGNLLSGSRGNVINPIVFFGLVYYYLRYTCRFRQRKLTIQRIVGIVLLAVGAMYLFFEGASAIGRDVSMFDPMEYIAVYLGGSIKNVDLFVGSHLPDNTTPGANTFGSLGIFPTPVDVGLMDFNYIGGYFLGNVRSCFARYYYDFGIWGSTLLLFIMGGTMQLMYERVIRGVNYSKRFFDFGTFLFLYMALGVMFCFFGERFYSLLSWFTVKGLIVIYLFNKVVLKISKPKYKTIVYG